MTREEIAAMPAGPELDALVAERVMGWTIEDNPTGYSEWRDAQGKGVWFYEGDAHDAPGFHPSTDIACAWEVVTYLRNKSHPGDFVANDFWPDRVSHHSEIQWVEAGGAQRDVEGWFVCFAKALHGVRSDGDGMAFAPTLPLAICRAALVTRLVENPATDDGIRPVTLLPEPS